MKTQDIKTAINHYLLLILQTETAIHSGVHTKKQVELQTFEATAHCRIRMQINIYLMLLYSPSHC